MHILGDLLSSVAIVLDRPFELGDFVIIDDTLGTVEHIGLKTTRIRSLFGEQIVVGNSQLLQSRIRNFKRMAERRIVFSLGVTYETPHDLVARIPGMIREIVEAREGVRFDRAHFQKYGDFALVFEAVYYVLSPDYNRYMDTQQAINLDVLERFQREGIEFAYPTQTLHVPGLVRADA
jgi:small-conductance mechanosensitive channel